MTPAMEEALHAQVKALEPLGLEDLREVWRKAYGPPPKLRSPDILRRLLAWKLQAAVHGGLDPDTRRVLRIAVGRATRADVWPGDRMVREWEGVRHEVVAVESGFVYAGQTYKSLSQVARAITGTRWNGPRFFGLRRDQAG